MGDEPRKIVRGVPSWAMKTLGTCEGQEVALNHSVTLLLGEDQLQPKPEDVCYLPTETFLTSVNKSELCLARL